MTVRRLPAARAPERRAGLDWDAPSSALEKWAERPLAAEADETATISIYDAIGEDWWTGEGVTAKRIAGALRAIGTQPVTVQVNSPGGDMFEGVAIYNLLREHPAEVTVKVMGLAASAASIIAMAGDRIEMGVGTFLMIHNAWGVVVGSDEDMDDAAAMFREFNAAMAAIYVARTGLDEAEIKAMMSRKRGEGTWLQTAEAVERGFADGTFEGPEAATSRTVRADIAARRQIEADLAKAGRPRSERRRLIREMTGTPSAAGTATPGAGLLDLGAAARLLATLKGH